MNLTQIRGELEMHPLFSLVLKAAFWRSQLSTARDLDTAEAIMNESLDSLIPPIHYFHKMSPLDPNTQYLLNLLTTLTYHILELSNCFLITESTITTTLQTVSHEVSRAIGERSTDDNPQPEKKGKRRSNHSPEIREILMQWLLEHADNPYPTQAEKLALCQKTGLAVKKVNDWFVNARRRILSMRDGVPQLDFDAQEFEEHKMKAEV
ncbi:Homeobox protein Meis3 [Basidiobolus ranarum]|uniref:Homeobox protein Meis3 n=1 Tax=Basidiobolus ranarum TaxID=34480 RepID=A0ABR2WPC4_9FUNG